MSLDRRTVADNLDCLVNQLKTFLRTLTETLKGTLNTTKYCDEVRLAD